MFKRTNLWRGLTVIFSLLLAVSLMVGSIVMNVDLADLASYDAYGAKTYIVDPGDYYIAIGASAHDALNNVLAAQGKTVADGMTADGDKSKTYKWTWLIRLIMIQGTVAPD